MNILAIYAHPDDAEFLASGSMAKWAKQGHEVYAIVATDGGMGTKTPGQSLEQVAAMRKAELTKAMEVIGGRAPEGFWYPDGFLSLHAQELKEKLTYWIRKLRADRILTLDPWRTYEVHPDHVEAGRMASEAAVFSCFPLFFPEHIKEGLEPHQPKEVWYMVPTQQLPNRVVDIAETFEQKVRSVLCHESQVQMLADWFVPGADPKHLTAAHKEQLAAGVRDLLRMMSGALGSKYNLELAEAFYAVKCGPGHFDIIQQILSETIANMGTGVEIH
jgi:LmbE family N-acetylglucosaminyl deacetylase